MFTTHLRLASKLRLSGAMWAGPRFYFYIAIEGRLFFCDMGIQVNSFIYMTRLFRCFNVMYVKYDILHYYLSAYKIV